MSGSLNAVFPLVFIGPMGAGKSRVGRRVARDLAVPFVDTDRRIEAEYGPIAQIFAREGEDYFRVLERELVTAALTEEAVVSLGGGAVLNRDTQTDLADCTVVYLTVSPEAVAARIGGSDRPLLNNGALNNGALNGEVEDPLASWLRIYDERRPIYEALCSTSVSTSGRSVGSIAADIVHWLKEKSGND
ncbi:shikimate kinase [Glaciibacter superstes]|uniref:shikimate kinase n=1 Tax=Glaciibacter superstes TaxID=501023 RepID=UPI0003B45637|nr:shikimate kinase [Glaciibacter superstes]